VAEAVLGLAGDAPVGALDAERAHAVLAGVADLFRVAYGLAFNVCSMPSS
jgi:hypothetical protein